MNRDGVVRLDDPSDEEGEERWSEDRGAIFLANLDDDGRACPTGETGVPDAELASCHDAADAVINGEADLRDLARLIVRSWPDAPPGTRAGVYLSPPGRARLFVREVGSSALPIAVERVLPDTVLRAGGELFLEGLDLVRDATVWDGSVDVRLELVDATGAPLGADAVRLRQAPLLFPAPIAPAATVYVSRVEGNVGSEVFRDGLRAAIDASSKRPRLDELRTEDPWTQDFFELGYMSAPAADGPQVMRVALRAPSVLNDPASAFPLRRAGRFVFTHLRGPDVAAAQQYDLATPRRVQTLNALGNAEVIPPYAEAPLGRLLIGRTETFSPDASFLRLLESQGAQAPLYVDTSWLMIAHVDEIFAFVPAETPRGWRVLVADPVLARRLLLDASAQGHGSALLFAGKIWRTREGVELAAERTIDEVLADIDVMTDSARAALLIEDQLELLRRETGLTEAEVVRVPFLHHPIDGSSTAYQPATVNGLLIDPHTWAAPDPHGPIVNGRDLFKVQLEQSLGAFGITVHWVEDWDLYHRQLGEVHCGTNVSRELPNVAWWEALR